MNTTNPDLVFVIGTSLIVQPFALLPGYVSPGVPRILLNNDPVADFDRPNDVFIQGDCDESIWKLCVKLGWDGELRELHGGIGGVERGWDTSFTSAAGEKTEDAGKEGGKDGGNEGGKEVEDMVEELTRELEEELRLDKEEDTEIGRVEDSEGTTKGGDEKVLKSDTWDENTVVVEKKDTQDEESTKEVKEKL